MGKEYYHEYNMGTPANDVLEQVNVVRDMISDLRWNAYSRTPREILNSCANIREQTQNMLKMLVGVEDLARVFDTYWSLSGIYARLEEERIEAIKKANQDFDAEPEIVDLNAVVRSICEFEGIEVE